MIRFRDFLCTWKPVAAADENTEDEKKMMYSDVYY